MKKKNNSIKLRVISLGGLNEIGKNMTVLECQNDIIIVDCGLGFPDDDMLGIDLVIPDISYLEQNAEKIRGIFLTHGHEDHIGALPYVLRNIDVPVYGTRLTLGIVRNKLDEHGISAKGLNTVAAGDTIKAGCFNVEFIHVNHSIADACCLAIDTPVGMVVHSGDFKLDLTPVDGGMMDLTRLGEIGKQGVTLLMCESTNVEEKGYTPSERLVGRSFDSIFERHPDKRIVVATFSSNVHRVQQIINTSARYNRKVAITGRSMLNIVKSAVELGYMSFPKDVLIDVNELSRYPKNQTTIITTGSQGEPMSALHRMAFGGHDKIFLGREDLVVISAHAIPGNEKLVGNIINELLRNGVSVFHDSEVEVHVSGHARQEEIKLMHALIKPKYFMPIHGEFKHLVRHRELAVSMGEKEDSIFVMEIGQMLEIDNNGAKINGVVPAGKVLVDGYGVGDIGNIVLRDRKLLSQDGIIIVVATVDINGFYLVSGPDVVSRGFVYVRESEELMDEARQICASAINSCLDNGICDWTQLKNRVRDDLSKYLYAMTKRKPVVLPIIMNV
ncbi:MAG: ribonuclease J [Ruminococcaceae bacterium]|nr:ribonuclease J [Oscillospiraceae bacterium]